MPKKRIYKILKWFFGIIIGLFLTISALLYFFKDDICDMAIAEVNKYLKAKVSVSDVDLAFWGSFPNLSIDFNNVFIQDSFEGATEKDTLLFSERIRCKFNPLDIWNENYTIKSVEVSPGTLQLKVNDEGLNNYDIIKEKKDSTDKESFEMNLKSIHCEGLRFSYTNDATDQKYSTDIDDIEIEGSLSDASFTAKAKTEFMINEARSGSVKLVSNQPAKLNVSVKVNSDSSTVVIPKSTIYIAELPFDFDVNYKRDSFNFELQAKDIEIDDAANKLSLDQTADVKKFSGTGKLLFDLNVNGTTNATDPAKVNCLFGVSNGTLTDPKSGITLNKINVDGKYSNEEGKEKEYLDLQEISFNTRGSLFRGKLHLSNFSDPIYQGEANGLINLAFIRSLLRMPSVDKLSGTVDVISQFKVHAIPMANGNTNYSIDRCTGNMKINKVLFKMKDDKRTFRNINGKAYLRSDEVGLENISLGLGDSDLKINGVFKELSAFLSSSGHLVADVDLKSKYIDVADLGPESKEEHIQQERSFVLFDDIDGRVYLDVARLKYESHNFYKLLGDMTMKKRVIHFPKLSVRNGGADAVGSLTIEERRPEIFYINSQMVSKNIEFAKLFKEWNNFEQDVIKSHNISGKAKANIQFRAPFDLRSGIIMDAIEAKIGLKIDKGRLKDVETFKYITESLRETSSARLAIGKDNINKFEKKLLDLRFDQMSNTILIKNSVITIPQMSISSNALDLEASGKHTFANKIDYRIGFRFRDLKEKQTSEFGEIVDDETGKYVFLRMYGDLDNPNIEWDKQTNREKRKEYNEEEVKNMKSILKSEFGLYKNDTTVKSYIQERREHEEIEIKFNPVDEIDSVFQETKPKKDTKARRLLNKWKKQQEAEKEEEFIIEQ
jgi:hypothetical protein